MNLYTPSALLHATKEAVRAWYDHILVLEYYQQGDWKDYPHPEPEKVEEAKRVLEQYAYLLQMPPDAGAAETEDDPLGDLGDHPF